MAYIEAYKDSRTNQSGDSGDEAGLDCHWKAMIMTVYT